MSRQTLGPLLIGVQLCKKYHNELITRSWTALWSASYLLLAFYCIKIGTGHPSTHYLYISVERPPHGWPKSAHVFHDFSFVVECFVRKKGFWAADFAVIWHFRLFGATKVFEERSMNVSDKSARGCGEVVCRYLRDSLTGLHTCGFS